MTTEAGLSQLIARNLPRQIMAVIADGGGEARLVGGVVRDVLNGSDPEAATDFDMAVNLLPDRCKALLETAGFRVIPTGIEHGTITVVDHKNGSIRAEVTSLRADIRTDGRHAEVVFGTDWLEDARRRDFTINTMYLSATGEVFDPFDGRADLAAGKGCGLSVMLKPVSPKTICGCCGSSVFMRALAVLSLTLMPWRRYVCTPKVSAGSQVSGLRRKCAAFSLPVVPGSSRNWSPQGLTA